MYVKSKRKTEREKNNDIRLIKLVFIDKDGKQFTLLLVINQRVLFDQMVKVAFVRLYDCLLSVSVKHNSLALFQTLNRCLKSQ